MTEKATHRIDVYTVDGDGRAAGPFVHDAAGRTPFGFATTRTGHVIVSEAGSAATSSYQLSRDGGLERQALEQRTV